MEGMDVFAHAPAPGVGSYQNADFSSMPSMTKPYRSTGKVEGVVEPLTSKPEPIEMKPTVDDGLHLLELVDSYVKRDPIPTGELTEIAALKADINSSFEEIANILSGVEDRFTDLELRLENYNRKSSHKI